MASNILGAIYTTFWDEWFWLPEETTWESLSNKGDGIYFPQVRDLLYAFTLAVILYLIRKFCERYVFTPFGVYCGISNKGHRAAPQNPVLEKAYHQYKHPDNDTIQALSKQTDFSSRHIERWFRIRRNQDKPTTMIKFTESTWRFTYYISVFIYGLIALWDKPWLWDSTQCWVGYPHHHVPPEIFWYYMIEMGFYWSLMFSQFIDVKRKDFWEMFAHHCATLFLMFFSWSGNFVRVGTLVLVVHDAVDYWMEAAKMAKYCDAQKLCSVLFAIFGVVWFITRLVIYPLKIIVSTLFYAHPIVGFGPVYYTYNFLLISLQILHIVWTVFICRIMIHSFRKEVKDVRSDEEEEVSEEEEEAKNGISNSKSHNSTRKHHLHSVHNANNVIGTHKK